MIWASLQQQFDIHINAKHRIRYTEIFIGLLLASLLINILSLAFPIALLQIYDRIIPNQAMATLRLLIIGVGIALLLELLLNIARTWVSGWMDARLDYLTSCHAFRKIINAKLSQVLKIGAGVQLERLNSLSGLKDFYGGQLFITMLDLPFVILYLGLIFYIGNTLVLVPLVVLILLITSIILGAYKLKKHLNNRCDTSDKRMNFIIQLLDGIHTVKSLGIESLMLRRYERLQEESADGNYKLAMVNNLNSNLGMLLGQVNLIMLVSYGAVLVISNDLSLGQLAACTILAGRSLQPISRIMDLWIKLQFVRISKKSLKKINALENECDNTSVSLGKVQGRIELKHVSFKYAESSSFILKDINLTLETGEIIAIRGSGLSGRSTLLNIIGGIYQPTKGKLYLGGKDIHTHDIREYRKKVGFLPEEGVLFEGTILENITLFRDGLYLRKALDIAELVGLNDFIENMPEGYLTYVGASTVDTIPKGIKQRVAIARALIDEPSIILFDEANSSLDIKGDGYILFALNKLKKNSSIIIVTHRPSTEALADTRYTLNNGILTRNECIE